MGEKMSVHIVVKFEFDNCCQLTRDSLALSEKYYTMCSWFLGHRGENAGIMKETMDSIVDQVKAGRMAFGSDDEVRFLAISQFPHLVSHIIRSHTRFL